MDDLQALDGRGLIDRGVVVIDKRVKLDKRLWVVSCSLSCLLVS
jgi:hypothetical protein